MKRYPTQEIEITTLPLSHFLEASNVPLGLMKGECAALINADVATDLLTNPTRLDAYIIGVCTEGEATVMLNMREVKLSKNTFFTLAPKHVLQFFYTNRLRISALIVSDSLFRRIPIDTKQLMPLSIEMERASMVFNEGEVEVFERYLANLHNELHNDATPFTNDLIGSTIASLMYKVGELIYRYSASHRDMSLVRSRAEDYFKLFIQELSQHFLEERNVGFYAERLDITPKYLTTLIKRVSGRSVSQWIDYYVTIEAKTMLKYTDKSILEISNALRFSNQSFFGSYFRRNAGMSPSQYRSMIGA